MARKTMQVSQILNPDFDITPESRGQLHDQHGNFRHCYVVSKTTNSTIPTVGQRLTKAEIDGYCSNEDWSVIIS